MKTLISISFTLITFVTSAQYSHLINADHGWKGVTYGWGAFDFFLSTNGDSIIDGIIWTKVYSGSSPDAMDYNVGLIREDPANQLVYIWTGSEDHILYDFDVVQGDVVSSWGVGMEQSITVTSVESVLVNGEYRDKINFEDSWGPAYWIEGIGSMYGIIDGVLGPVADYNPVLTCFYDENILGWSNPTNAEECGLTMGIPEVSEEVFEVFPNPFNESISISPQIFQSQTGELLITDMMGNMVYRQNIQPFRNYTVDTPALASGVYIMTLNYPKASGSKRLVKL